MKKIFVLCCLIFVIFSTTSCKSNNQNGVIKEVDHIEMQTFENLTEISLKDYVQFSQKNDRTIVILSNLIGNYDKDFVRKLDQMQLELNVPIYILNVSTFSTDDDDYLSYVSIMDNFTDIFRKENENSDSLIKVTPIITIFENKKEKSVFVSDKSYDEIKEWLVKQI